ncbi:MAG: hypothetical protein MZV63_34300 [Marinilabiliales bacterium]|nr:hypothetical protein [Marinilabiliales bacterium]
MEALGLGAGRHQRPLRGRGRARRRRAPTTRASCARWPASPARSRAGRASSAQLSPWRPTMTHYAATGQWWGAIAEAPRGEGGFGYDPVFVPEGSDLSVAEWPQDAKDRASHRALAGEGPRRRLATGGAAAMGSNERLTSSGGGRAHEPTSPITRSSRAPRRSRSRRTRRSSCSSWSSASSSGSIAIISEALHSGSDLVAAIIAYWSVRRAAQPPDAAPSLRPREGREPQRRHRGAADHRRRRA